MSSISFLKNRQIGGKCRSEFKNRNSSLNLDHIFSRLVCHKKDILTVRGEETDVPPFSAKFRRDAQSDLLAVANEDGDISLYDTSKQHPESFLKCFIAHHNAIFDVCWVPDKCQLISASGDHNAALWDISCCKLVSVFKKHTASIKSIDICREQSAIFATGSRDGSINVWDTREKNGAVYLKPAIGINQAHCRKNTVYSGRRSSQKDPISSVSAVAFQDSNNLASAGVADGIVKIWDLRRTYLPNSKYLPSPKYQMHYSESGNIGPGCTSLAFDSSYKTLYGCSTNHKILKFNCHSYTKEVEVYEGFRCTTYFIKLALSSDDQYLLCGSSDEKAYIWKTSKPGLPIMKLGAHTAEVTSVCWSPYSITKLATCGDDNKVAVWKIAEVEISDKLNEDILAVAEPYSEGPKNYSPPVQVTVQSSTIASSFPIKKSPVLPNQTPKKPSVRAITSFFSPVTPTFFQTSFKSIPNTITLNSNNSPNSSNKLLNKSPSAESSSQVLTPSNHINKNNILCQSPSDSTETLSSPEFQNSSPENKNCETSFLGSSLFVQNKENSCKNISPETVYKVNSIGQTKRKVTVKHCTPNVKRKQTENSKKTKGLVKLGMLMPVKNAGPNHHMEISISSVALHPLNNRSTRLFLQDRCPQWQSLDKKTPPEKTIMSYFSVVLSSDN